MAKKIKFPLDMGNGNMVRTIEELKECFNIERVMSYFFDGQLLIWLQDRYYDSEAEQIEALSADMDKDTLSVKLSGVFGIAAENNIDVNDVLTKHERIIRLREYTSDDHILDNVDKVAFDQEELEEMLENGAKTVYLVDATDSFIIYPHYKNVRYIGVSTPEVLIGGYDSVDLEELNIKIEKCFMTDATMERIIIHKAEISLSENDIERSVAYDKSDESINNVQNETGDAQSIYDQGNVFLKEKKYSQALLCFKKSADMELPAAQYMYAHMYAQAIGVEKNIQFAIKWYTKAAEKGDGCAYMQLGHIYRNNKEYLDYHKALDCYQKGFECGNNQSAIWVGKMYYSDEYGVKDIEKGKQVFIAAIANENDRAIIEEYACALYSNDEYEKALEYFEKCTYSYDYEKGFVITNRANCHYKLGNIDKALQLYKEVADIYDDACYALIKHYKAVGNKIQALKWYHYAEEKHGYVDEDELGFNEADLLLGDALSGTAVSEKVTGFIDKVKIFSDFFK